MSAKAVRNAKKRRVELLQELEKIDQFLSLYEEFSDAPSKKEVDSKVTSGGNSPPSAGPVENKSPAKPAEIAAAARQIILEAKKPLTRGELASRLLEMGLNLSASDKAKYVGTIMWRHKDAIRQLEGFGYWPVDVDYEPANHFAGDREDNDPSGKHEAHTDAQYVN